MSALRILMLCVTAALVSASIRSVNPQIASAVALACGIAALMLSAADIKSLTDAIVEMEESLPATGGERYFLLKLCGIALIAEFASDICRDCGETALARRIDTGTKIAVAAAALPTAVQLMEGLSSLFK